MARRTFLRGVFLATLSAPFISARALHAADANSKLQHACIGVGGMMGGGDLDTFLQHPKLQVAALCDVDENHLKKAAEKAPGARLYRDWREMFEKEGDRIDSVNVTVPDHMHYPISMAAIRHKKHVYCQKPLCHDVTEVRTLTTAAAKAKVVTQLGSQFASTVGNRRAVKLFQDGAIGKVKRVVLCANRPGAIEAYRLLGPRAAQGAPPPASLNWDLWIGTAPMRPFVANDYHPVKWRAWQDFGTGWSGDIGCHVMDAVWRALDLKAPLSVSARVQDTWEKSPERRADTWPQSEHITWIFPGNQWTAGNQVVVEWFDGLFFPPKEVTSLFTIDNYPTESAMILGTEGAMLLPLDKSPYLLPLEKFEKLPRPAFENRNHYHHFVDACLGLAKTESHFGQTGPMTETILLGTVAMRMPNTVLEWDAAAMRIPNQPTAERFLRRSYREGWSVEKG
jgi:predicted dehydrogenase